MQRKNGRKVYHVSPDQGGWMVKAEGGSRKLSTHSHKPEAVAAARERAQSDNLGQVIVHKKDGTIQTEYTYGADPRDIPG